MINWTIGTPKRRHRWERIVLSVSGVALLWLVSVLGGCIDNGPEKRSALSEGQREAANDHANLSQLVEALNIIESFHAKHQTGLKLNPPLGKIELETLLSGFPCTVPDELRAMWAWRDGEATDKFVWYHRFLPVDDAVAEYKKLRLTPLLGWPKEWIPVFEYEGEWYAVECHQNKTVGAPVIHYFTEDDPKLAYTNLTTYVTSMSEAMGTGALGWKNQWWVEDIQALSRIHAKLNPGIGFPYHISK